MAAVGALRSSAAEGNESVERSLVVTRGRKDLCYIYIADVIRDP